MFIICPKCSAKYQIPEGITLQEGQKLKCSACDFVFLKGEESPLVLEQPIVQEPAEATTEAFSTPLYTQPDSENQATSPSNIPLPEAFQPVSNPAKSRTYLWFIPIYIILIIALCMMGWHFRGTLKPSIKEIVPKVKIEKNIPMQERKAEVKQPVKESVKPAVQQKKENVTPIIKPKQSVAVEKEVMTTPTDTTLAFKTIPATEKGVKEMLPSEPIRQAEPHPQVNPNQPVITTDLMLPSPEEELVPLFEAIAEPVSTATKEELELTQISFKITPNEQGMEQLLVEGLLQNKTDVLRSVPALTVVLFDKDNNILNRKKVHLDNERLEPKQALPFYTGITPVPAGVNHIDVQF